MTLDPARDIQPLIGSNDGILHATLARANVGDKDVSYTHQTLPTINAL